MSEFTLCNNIFVHSFDNVPQNVIPSINTCTLADAAAAAAAFLVV